MARVLLDTIKIPQGDILDRDVVQSYTDAQVATDDKSGNEEIAQRVRAFVDVQVSDYRSQMDAMFLRWRVNNHVLRGNSVVETPVADVHVPACYTALETKIPRLVDGVMDYPQWFQVVGRDERDQEVEETRAAYLQWQLNQMGWMKLVEPSARSMETYQCAVARVVWDRKFVKTIEREPVKDDTGRVTEINVYEVEKLAFDGPRAYLVDPYNLIIDPYCTDANDALYIGEQFFITETELREREEAGIYRSGVCKEVQDKKFGGRSTINRATDAQRARSVTTKIRGESHSDKGGAKVYQAVELWCEFDLYGDGIPVECVLTVIEHGVVAQARENFMDSKRRPYAIARAAKEAWDFFNTGPLDHAIRLNEELDRQRAVQLRGAELGVSFAVAPPGADMPTSLYDIVPGTIFRGTAPLQWNQVPDSGRATLQTQAAIYNDIEEATGAYKILKGGEAGNTALEADVRHREGNKRMRNEVRALGEMHLQLLRIMDDMNRQFTLMPVKFRVLGKASKRLGDYATIGPDTMLLDVDFEIQGMTNINTRGVRAQQLRQWAQNWAPFATFAMGAIDIVELLRSSYALEVDEDSADKVFRGRTRPEDLLPQEEEMEFLLAGMPVEVNRDDDHQNHLRVIEDQGMWPPGIGDRPAGPLWGRLKPHAKAQIQGHVLNHLLGLRREQTEQRARARQQEMMLPGGPGQGAPPAPGGMTQTQAGLSNGPTVPQRDGPASGRARTATQQEANAGA